MDIMDISIDISMIHVCMFFVSVDGFNNRKYDQYWFEFNSYEKSMKNHHSFHLLTLIAFID